MKQIVTKVSAVILLISGILAVGYEKLPLPSIVTVVAMLAGFIAGITIIVMYLFKKPGENLLDGTVNKEAQDKA